VSSRVGPSVAKKPGPLAAASGGSFSAAMTVIRPECRRTGIVPVRTRGTMISPNVRSIGRSAAEDDAARASAAIGTRSTSWRRKTQRVARP
jgi:hypothetical protein